MTDVAGDQWGPTLDFCENFAKFCGPVSEITQLTAPLQKNDNDIWNSG